MSNTDLNNIFNFVSKILNMKSFITFLMLFTFGNVFSQSKAEEVVTRLSKGLFKWEVENKIDSIENLLSNQLVVVNSKGE